MTLAARRLARRIISATFAASVLGAAACEDRPPTGPAYVLPPPPPSLTVDEKPPEPWVVGLSFTNPSQALDSVYYGKFKGTFVGEVTYSGLARTERIVNGTPRTIYFGPDGYSQGGRLAVHTYNTSLSPPAIAKQRTSGGDSSIVVDAETLTVRDSVWFLRYPVSGDAQGCCTYSGTQYLSIRIFDVGLDVTSDKNWLPAPGYVKIRADQATKYIGGKPVPYDSTTWTWKPRSGTGQTTLCTQVGQIGCTVWVYESGWAYAKARVNTLWKSDSVYIHVGEAELELHVEQNDSTAGDAAAQDVYTLTAAAFPDSINGVPVSLSVLGWRWEGTLAAVASRSGASLSAAQQNSPYASTYATATTACPGTPNPCVTAIEEPGTMYVTALVNGVEKEASASFAPRVCPPQLFKLLMSVDGIWFTHVTLIRNDSPETPPSADGSEAWYNTGYPSVPSMDGRWRWWFGRAKLRCAVHRFMLRGTGMIVETSKVIDTEGRLEPIQ